MVEDIFKGGQRKDYIELLRTSTPEEHIIGIRYSTRTVRPFGSEDFIKKMERKLDRRFILKPPGRPKKKKGT